MKFRNQKNRVASSSGAFSLFTFLFLFVSAALTHAGDFTYTTNNSAITITKYTGSGGSVTIPEMIDGLPVTSIGTNAFSGFFSLTSITIPDSVTTIGTAAFSGCYSLTNVLIGKNITNIGTAAFSKCFQLNGITIDVLNSTYSSVDGVLFNKSQTILIKFPDSMAGTYSIPNTVTSIGYRAFENCSRLTSVTIPDSVATIEDNTFYGCYSLTNVVIGKNVTSIGTAAFSRCFQLRQRQ